MSFDHVRRISGLRDTMELAGVDAALLSIGSDLPYFTGYDAMPSERLTVLVVPRAGEPVLFVPRLEAPRVGPGPFEVRSWNELEDPVALAASMLNTPTKVAVGDQMWSVFLTRFQRHWTNTDWVPASEVTSSLRVRKDDGEVELLRRAAHSVDRVMARVPDEVRFSGRTETEVASELRSMTLEEGHDVAGFAIVGSGPNGASPHHDAGDRVIEDGDLVVCDYGGRLSGYYSDSTRTFVVGEPSSRQVEIHELVLEANRAGREEVGPGVPCQQVDRAARAVIEGAGYGDYFIHRTGHGIGLDVHEHPYMVEGNERPLEVGMAFSVEPGIYLSGELGVRIEDIVVCAEDGADTLNQSDRGLVPVD